MNWQSSLSGILAICAILVATGAHRAARRRRNGGDCGDYWAGVVHRICYWLGIPLLLSTIIESISETFWLSGWHLHFDRVLGYRWAFPVALALPFAVWAIFLAAGLRTTVKGRELSNWLAGSVGFTTSRLWVLHCAWLLLLPLLWFGRERLGLGKTGYPAVAWGTLAVLVISLVGVAASSAPQQAAAVPLPERRQASAKTDGIAQTLPPWPEALGRDGFDLQFVVTWNGDENLRPVSARAADFADRLRLMGVRGVPPEVIESFHQLISPLGDERRQPRTRLLFAPDDCGQVEALALAAYDLSVQFSRGTLIITPCVDAALLQQLKHWLSQAARGLQHRIELLEVHSGAKLAGPAGLWVVDSATLSEDFMTRLADPEVAKRIGFVVWWNVHAYTGVLAANVWAISRRLHRIMQERVGNDVRTLATVRYASHPDAQLPAFVRRLLPYSFVDRETHVERFFSRTVHVYRIRGQTNYFEAPRPDHLPELSRHLSLAVAYASARQGWVTNIEVPRDIPEDERRQMLDVHVGDQRLRDALVETGARAGARILKLEAADTLSIIEKVAQGGRAAPVGIPHYVGLVASENPYVGYLLERLGTEKTLPASRRLIGAEGHEAIFRRHLLLALSEHEDTRSGLLDTFLWEEKVVQQTLDDLATQNKLSRREVRYLDSQNNRKVEYLYRSLQAVDSQKRPLDTVGDKLMLVREAEAPAEEGGIRMKVDIDRVQIQAYPHRVFLSNGYRYRIRDWKDRRQEWIACTREATHATTWRIHSSSISEVKRAGRETVFGRGGAELKQFPVSAKYQEWADGVLRREYDPTGGKVRDDTIHYSPHLFCSFNTTALVLQLLPAAEDDELRAVCLALRHVLPVHIGVEEDALEVVPLIGQTIGQNRVNGLAIVDLYPHGIGLVDAIKDDQQFVQTVLEWTHNWLEDAVRKQQTGESPNALHSPMAVATGGSEDPQKGLMLLNKLFGDA